MRGSKNPSSTEPARNLNCQESTATATATGLQPPVRAFVVQCTLYMLYKIQPTGSAWQASYTINKIVLGNNNEMVQAMVFKFNFVEQARVGNSSSVVMPHRLAFLNIALIRSTSLFRMNP